MEEPKKASTITTLRIGEVDAPVALYKTATEPKSRQWDDEPDAGATGDPLAGTRQKAGRKSSGAKGTGPVKAPPKPKGIIKVDGTFVDLSEQIEQIAESTALEYLEIHDFIRRERVPRERVVGNYWIGVAEGDGFPPARILAHLVDVLKETGRVAVVRFTKRKGQTMGVISAHRSGALLLQELAFAENCYCPPTSALVHVNVELPESEREAMRELVDNRSESYTVLDEMRDVRKMAEEELVTRAEHGELDDYTLPEVDPEEEVLDVAQILRESVKAVSK
jgi:non-homologous end joining protein Ku